MPVKTDLAPENGHSRVFERVREAVLHGIREGDLVPGDRLPSERELSSRFSISRSAVREALRTLEISGVLRFEKGQSGGAFVRESSADGISRSFRDMVILGRMPLSDLMTVRRSLLVLAIELATERAAEDDFDRLDASIDRMIAAIATGDNRASVVPIMEFNRLLGRISQNPVLELVVDMVSKIMTELLQELQLPTSIDLVSPRRAIVSHMRRGEAEAAKNILADHLEETTRYVLASANLAERDPGALNRRTD